MKLKHLQNIFHVIVNAHSIVQYPIEIENEIMINANASVKRIVRAQKITVGKLVYVFVRMVSI